MYHLAHQELANGSSKKSIAGWGMSKPRTSFCSAGVREQVNQPLPLPWCLTSQEWSILGSAFFCKRSDVALSDPTAFWRTVAFDLAQRNAVIAGKVIENLKAGKVDPMREEIESHFRYLIEDPQMEFQNTCDGKKLQSRGIRGIRTREVSLKS